MAQITKNTKSINIIRAKLCEKGVLNGGKPTVDIYQTD